MVIILAEKKKGKKPPKESKEKDAEEKKKDNAEEKEKDDAEEEDAEEEDAEEKEKDDDEKTERHVKAKEIRRDAQDLGDETKDESTRRKRYRSPERIDHFNDGMDEGFLFLIHDTVLPFFLFMILSFLFS